MRTSELLIRLPDIARCRNSHPSFRQLHLFSRLLALNALPVFMFVLLDSSRIILWKVS